jgi:hypothetical protein
MSVGLFDLIGNRLRLRSQVQFKVNEITTLEKMMSGGIEPKPSFFGVLSVESFYERGENHQDEFQLTLLLNNLAEIAEVTGFARLVQETYIVQLNSCISRSYLYVLFCSVLFLCGGIQR